MRTTIIALVLASPATAAEWWHVVTDAKNSVTFIDATSIERSGSQVAYWGETIHKEPIEGAKSHKWRAIEDCAAKTNRVVSFIAYGPADDVLDSGVNDDAPFRPIPPDSAGEAIQVFVCGGAAGAATDRFAKLVNVTPAAVAEAIHKADRAEGPRPR